MRNWQEAQAWKAVIKQKVIAMRLEWQDLLIRAPEIVNELMAEDAKMIEDYYNSPLAGTHLKYIPTMFDCVNAVDFLPGKAVVGLIACIYTPFVAIGGAYQLATASTVELRENAQVLIRQEYGYAVKHVIDEVKPDPLATKEDVRPRPASEHDTRGWPNRSGEGIGIRGGHGFGPNLGR